MSYACALTVCRAKLNLNTAQANNELRTPKHTIFGFARWRLSFWRCLRSSSLFTNAKTAAGGGAQASQVAQASSIPSIYTTTQWTYV